MPAVSTVSSPVKHRIIYVIVATYNKPLLRGTTATFSMKTRRSVGMPGCVLENVKLMLKQNVSAVRIIADPWRVLVYTLLHLGVRK